MRFLLRLDFFVYATELFLKVFDLLPCRFALLATQFHRRGAGQPPLGAVYYCRNHLQIAY